MTWIEIGPDLCYLFNVFLAALLAGEQLRTEIEVVLGGRFLDIIECAVKVFRVLEECLVE